MQFNVVPRTGGLAINRKNRGKRGVQRHNSHTIQHNWVDLGRLGSMIELVVHCILGRFFDVP